MRWLPSVSRRNELLEKWERGELEYSESLKLRQILQEEARQAEETRRTLIILALIGLALYALSRRS